MISLRLPAGTPASLKAAVDAGADAVYTGLASATNARSFPGLNLSADELAEGVAYAHARGCEVYVASNIHPQLNVDACLGAVDAASEAGADAVIVSDVAVLEYAAARHPNLRRHLSCIATATSAAAINLYRDHFGIECAVLPRVTSVADIAEIRAETDVEIEVFVFGVL